MQPMSGTSKAASYLITARDGDRTHDPLNSEQFWRRKVDDVRVDEVFFHTYFEKSGKAKQADRKTKKKDRRKDDSEDGSDDDDEIWQALVKSRPDVEGDGGDDDDLSDFDMDDMMSDDEAGGMDGGVELNLGSDDDEDIEEEAVGGHHEAEDDDDFENFDLDDEDAFMDSDAEVPVELNLGDDDDEDKDKDGRKTKKRKLKSLPTFASMDDYAKLIGDDDSE
jgi:ribosome biogenesis protein MAK21